MTGPFFFSHGAGMTVREIAALTGAQPVGSCDLDARLFNVAALDRARSRDLVYCETIKYAAQLAATRAGACLVPEKLSTTIPPGAIVLTTPTPYHAFVTVAQALFPDSSRPATIFDPDSAREQAHIHPSARLESGVRVDPGVIIGPGAEVGSGTTIAAHAVIGRSVRIGRNCAIGSSATIEHALIGDRVIIHAGCRIGQDGFGYASDAAGHHKVPQLGRVIIQDEVEIGANTTIDRGGLSDTVIGEGAKIDNLVQIAHNVSIGRRCIIASQCGISGSVTLGDHAVLGGQVGVADHIAIGEGARIGAQSGVIGDIPPGETWLGYPAMRGREYMRAIGIARRLRTISGEGGPPPRDEGTA